MRFNRLLKVLVAFLLLFQKVTAQVSLARADTVLYQLTYVLTYRPDSLSADIRRENMVLLTSQTRSVFYPVATLLQDSLFATQQVVMESTEEVQRFMNKLSALPRTRFYYRIYKSYPEQQVRYVDDVREKHFENSHDFALFRWKIYLADTATVAGYPCQRATTSFAGRRYEAWFTRTVPISDGPYRFAGLPGLIVKISDTQHHHSFVLSSLRDVRGRKQPLTSFTKFTIPAPTLDIYRGQRNELQQLAGSPTDDGGPPTTQLRISKERRDQLLRRLATDNNRIERRNFSARR